MDLTFNLSDVLTGGKHRSIFQDLIVLYGQEFVKHFRNQNKTCLFGLAQNEFTKSEVLSLAQNNVLIEHWSIAIQVPVEILDVKVPDPLPNRTYIDDNDNEVVKTFQEWGDQPLQTSNDGNEVLLRGVINGNSLTSDEWKLFEDSTSSVRTAIDDLLAITEYNIEVLGPKEINELRQTNNWTQEENI